jgi:hypothetical protein
VTDLVPDRRFQFEKRSQLFIRVRNETLSVVAMRVGNEDCSPIGINRCDAAPAPTGFAESVSDDFHYASTIAFVSLGKRQQGTKQRRSSEVCIEAIAPLP